jgi:hypothetical protein
MPAMPPINGEEIDMGRWSSVPAMIALAAVLSAPVIIEAENSLTDPTAMPDATVVPTVAAAGPSEYENPLIGASVYNVQNERIGCIVAVPAGYGNRTPGVVLVLGGFRGIAGKVVEVPVGSIELVNDKLVIAGATKGQLMQLPAFQFGSRS